MGTDTDLEPPSNLKQTFYTWWENHKQLDADNLAKQKQTDAALLAKQKQTDAALLTKQKQTDATQLVQQKLQNGSMLMQQNEDLLQRFVETDHSLNVFGRQRDYTESRYVYLSFVSMVFKLFYVLMVIFLAVAMVVSKREIHIAAKCVIFVVFCAYPIACTYYIEQVSTLITNLYETIVLALGMSGAK